ncbi:MAG TPA: thioesterase family protein, partial [Lacunisphaera sp.]|nr:thioesterase family protein [Lacunisphaera sp.]
MLESRVQITVRYAETDMMGIVYHGNYLPWFEVGRTTLLKECGLPYRELEAQGYRLPVIELGTKFFKPALYDDIDGVSPRQGWGPLELVEGWFNDTYSASYRYRTVGLERVEGLVTLRGRDYADLGDKHDDVHPELPLLLGWINHDKTLFSPPKNRRGDDIDKIRVEKATQWETSFIGWGGA